MNDIDLAIYIAPSRACILKPSVCIAGRRRNILNEKYRITYRIVQGVIKRMVFRTVPKSTSVENGESSEHSYETVRFPCTNALFSHTLDKARFLYNFEKITGTSTY